MGEKDPECLLNPKSGHHPSSAENSARALPSLRAKAKFSGPQAPARLPATAQPSLTGHQPPCCSRPRPVHGLSPRPGTLFPSWGLWQLPSPLARFPCSPPSQGGPPRPLAETAAACSHRSLQSPAWPCLPQGFCVQSPACQVTHLSRSMPIVHPPAENKAPEGPGGSPAARTESGT